jgi:hypothetical protein
MLQNTTIGRDNQANLLKITVVENANGQIGQCLKMKISPRFETCFFAGNRAGGIIVFEKITLATVLLTFLACLQSHPLTCSNPPMVSWPSQNLAIGPPEFLG